MSDEIERLYAGVLARRGGDIVQSRTSKLLTLGTNKIAQKVGEEAVEVVVDAVGGDRHGVVLESVDLLYHLVALWAHLDIPPDEIWAEMTRRHALLGIAEKLPKIPGDPRIP